MQTMPLFDETGVAEKGINLLEPAGLSWEMEPVFSAD